MSKLVTFEFFEELANVAASQSLPFFRTNLDIENKKNDGFDPVTLADKKTEEALRHVIETYFPHDGIFGEEKGVTHQDAEYIWVIDPIDGTRAFISGLPVWGTLVGLQHHGKALAGMMAQPFTGELFVANQEGAFFKRKNESTFTPMKTRATERLDQATLFSTAPELFKGEKKQRFENLTQNVRLTRFGTDCYAFAMLAAGYVDLVVETGLQPYDIMALIPLIEKAGGVISQWNGGCAEEAGDIIAAATPELHQAARRYLNEG